MPPTPSRMMFTCTCSCGSRTISSASASSEPATSALSTRLSSFSPRSARASTSSSETRRAPWRASASCLTRIERSLATRLASRSFWTTRKVSPASGTPSKPRISTGMPGVASSTRRAAEVVHRAHAAPVLAGHDGVADLHAAAVDQERDDGAAARVEPRLDHEPARLGVGVGPQLLDLRERDERLEQVVEVLVRLGRHVDELGVAAPVGRREALLGQLAADAVRVRALLVDLVDGDHDRHLGGLGVVDRLDRLRHDAVVGGHHDHGDVRDLGAAGAHGREGLVARRVEEGDRVAVVVDLVGADVLRDAAGLARGDLGLADGVEQRRLPVVDVAHDRDHGRALDQLVVGVLVGRLLLDVVGRRVDRDLLVEAPRRAPRWPRRRASA